MLIRVNIEPLNFNIKNSVTSRDKPVKSYEFIFLSHFYLWFEAPVRMSSLFICGFSGMLRFGIVPGLHLGRTEEQVLEPAATENKQIQPENRLSFGESVLKR
ncbi:hypothetical protein AVEN_40766-1 [Araneus ventricosus]|uniref:Uncharacterized protein n=1 Tax=Araneus ventricosus TaxID=182803 RepID=A0A4Y2KCJ7_ARAVE|nr:hypothetical protein AVEN_40766-1 [Araneus ventricosus]